MWYWELSSKFLSLSNSWGFLFSSPWGEKHMVLLFQECSWAEVGGWRGCFLVCFFLSVTSAVGWAAGGGQPVPSSAPLLRHHTRSWTPANPLGKRSTTLLQNSVLSISAGFSKSCESPPSVFLLIGVAEISPVGPSQQLLGLCWTVCSTGSVSYGFAGQNDGPVSQVLLSNLFLYSARRFFCSADVFEGVKEWVLLCEASNWRERSTAGLWDKMLVLELMGLRTCV